MTTGRNYDTMSDTNDLTESLLHADGQAFQPLENVVLFDDFEDSRSGWYMHHISGDTYEKTYDFNWGVVCRSSMTAHRYGSYGSQSGHYSLKVATRPEAGQTTAAIKRLTHPYFDGELYDRLRFETFFTYHEEPRGDREDTSVRPERADLTGESNVRSFLFEMDVHDQESRWWPGFRYLNYDGDEKVGTWQYNPTTRDPLLSEYTDLPGASQDLCWNSPNDSVPWKPNWHYLRFDVDVKNRTYLEFQCNDTVVDMTEYGPEADGGYDHINGLLNPILRVETNSDARSFLFADAVAMSAEVRA